MSVIGSNVLAGASGQAAGFQIDRSLRFDSSSSSYLNRTPSSAGNRKTWTWSGWIKRSKLGAWSVIFSAAGSGSNDYLAFDPSDRLTFDLANSGSGSKLTTRVFRDCSAFYHIVLAVDYTSATANDRIKLYVNGVLETTFDTNTAPAQNHSGNVNNNTAHRISSVPTGIDFFNGYLADVHFIDGQELAPTDFGEYDDNNVWQPIEYAGTYGPLVDQSQTWSTYGTYTGSTNNASGTGWQSAFDSSLTTYTWSSSGSDLTFTNAISYTSKVEIYGYKFDAADEIRVNGSAVSGFNIGNTDSSLGWVTALTGSGSLTSIGSTGFGLVASVRVDGKLLIDSGISIPNNSFKLDFSDNSSNAALGYDAAGSNDWTVNNLVATAGLETANQGFDVVTYTGNGTSQSITGLGFSPDLVWIKERNGDVSHQLYDGVRGATKKLSSNTTDAEATTSTGLTSFDSTGFSLGSYSSVNNSSDTYVAWCWKAGGTAASNTDGTITSSVSANTTYGFSIVSYTGNGGNGSTVGHGLGAAPSFIIVKQRIAGPGTDLYNWNCYHSSLGATKYIALNSTAAAATAALFNDTSPTSSVFSLGSSTGTFNNVNNANNVTYIAYCWSEVSGFSKFGSYTGSGVSGKKITTDFKPKFLLIKRTSTTGYWNIVDSQRGGGEALHPNLSNAASSGGPWVTFDNDGFTLTTTGDGYNDSGDTFIYAAFAGIPAGEIIDSLIDTPTNYTAGSGNNGGNYATLNPLDSNIGSNLTNGNLDAAGSSNWSAGHARGTFGLTSGKWYWEVTRTGGSGATAQIGFCNKAFSLTTSYGSLPADSWTFAFGNGTEILRPSGGGTGYFSGSAMGVGDIAGIALDMDNKTAVFYKNGTAGATIDLSATSTGSTDNIDELFPLVGVYNANVALNFGQRPFAYTPPTGHLSLCTQNLTDPTIADGSDYFDVDLYTGTSATHVRSNFSFGPDFVWIKGRSFAGANMLFDAVRGATKRLVSNQTLAEGTVQGVTSFDSNGFTLGNDPDCNWTTRTFVAWAWDAGTTTVSNTDGTGTTNVQVRANPSAGFSIVTYTGGSSTPANSDSGDSFGHGLNAAPQLVICKKRTGANSWPVYHASTALGALVLDGTNALDTGSYLFAQKHPSSSVVYLGNNPEINNSSHDYVAYCFAPVEGYSAFGSYTGNGSADGPFVYTGFRPAFLIIKNASQANSWFIMDTKRNTFNVVDDYLLAESSAAEASSAWIDILSNGFKIRSTATGNNNNGIQNLYIAFAEHPFSLNGGLAR